LTAAVAFLLLGFLVPEQFAAGDSAAPLEIGRDVDKLVNQIDVLKQEKLLEHARAEDLKQKLDQLQKEATGKTPAKTLEALDHLMNVTHQTAQKAAESLLTKTELLAKTETLAAALQKVGSSLDEKRLSQALKELAALAQKADLETGFLSKELEEALRKAARDGAIRPEQLKALAGALRETKSDMALKMAKLHQAGLIDLETLQRCAGCGQCKDGALAAALKEGAGDKPVGQVLTECMAGRGGLNKGPGRTSLTFGEETSEEAIKFKEVVLPPSALKEHRLGGMSKQAPKKETAAGPSQPGALQGAKAGGGSANTQPILPQHRKAVERFFERPAESEK
jgi:hypothetical protein